MADDGDDSIEEKRVHGERRNATRAVVASGLGLATVDISDDQIGRFGLAHRCVARDVAGDGRLAVATDDHVLVGNVEILEATDFGPAVAVGFVTSAPAPSQEGLVAAGPDGRIARRDDDDWVEVGTVEAPVAAIDGALLAAADGAYRIGDGLEDLGLDDVGSEGVRDVATGPYAATADGVYRHTGADWALEREGDATVVASDGDRVHAVVDGTVCTREPGDAGDAAWTTTDCPAEDVVAVAHAEATYAITRDGTFLVDPATAKDGAPGWRSRSLGLSDVVGLAVL